MTATQIHLLRTEGDYGRRAPRSKGTSMMSQSWAGARAIDLNAVASSSMR